MLLTFLQLGLIERYSDRARIEVFVSSKEREREKKEQQSTRKRRQGRKRHAGSENDRKDYVPLPRGSTGRVPNIYPSSSLQVRGLL